MPKKLTTEEFIEKAKKVHGERYDYSKVEYKLTKIPVVIICKEHGSFTQLPSVHLRGHGCLKCISLELTTVVNRANEKHNFKYTYLSSLYTDMHTKMEILCQEHGIFYQTPNSHLRGTGCPKCAKGYKYSTTEWIEKAKVIHGKKYTYENVIYHKSNKKVDITCLVHGAFLQTPNNHLRGKGCEKCHSGLFGIKTLGLDGTLYKSMFEATVSDGLFVLQQEGHITNYEYEVLIGFGQCTCDFVITLRTTDQKLWVELDGMGNSRRQTDIYISYDKAHIKQYSKKIQYYKDNKFNLKILSFNDDIVFFLNSLK